MAHKWKLKRFMLDTSKNINEPQHFEVYGKFFILGSEAIAIDDNIDKSYIISVSSHFMNLKNTENEINQPILYGIAKLDININGTVGMENNPNVQRNLDFLNYAENKELRENHFNITLKDTVEVLSNDNLIVYLSTVLVAIITD